MTENCPKCGSYNVEYTTSGVVCIDCRLREGYIVLADSNTEEIKSQLKELNENKN